MPVSQLPDPLRNFKFQVQLIPRATNDTAISEISKLGFMSASGLNVTNEMIPYREGAWNTVPHKMVGQSDYGPITLMRGMFADEEALYNWQRMIQVFQTGSGLLAGGGDYRCDAIIRVFDHPATNGASWTGGAPSLASAKVAVKVFNCWPQNYAINDLNAGENSLLVQQLTLVNEGWEIKFGAQAALANPWPY